MNTKRRYKQNISSVERTCGLRIHVGRDLVFVLVLDDIVQEHFGLVAEDSFRLRAPRVRIGQLLPQILELSTVT